MRGYGASSSCGAERSRRSCGTYKRLLYVACTRALDQLILPQPSWSREDSWLKILDLRIGQLASMRNLEPALPPVPEQPPLAPPTASEFANDDARIQAATRAINWRRPSRDDSERNLLDAVSVDDPIEQDASVPPLAVAAAGQLRGIILHKLMEELLGRQVADDVAALTERASILAEQVALPEGGVPDAAELAQVAFDCFHHQSLAPYIALLVPELPLYGSRSDVELVAARADAVALDNGRPTMVVDWKSDKEPTPATRLAYEDQLLQYLELLDIETGALVYMTKRQVQFFHRKRAPAEA